MSETERSPLLPKVPTNEPRQNLILLWIGVWRLGITLLDATLTLLHPQYDFHLERRWDYRCDAHQRYRLFPGVHAAQLLDWNSISAVILRVHTLIWTPS